MPIHNRFNDSDIYTRMVFMGTGLSTCDLLIVTGEGLDEVVSLIWDLDPRFYFRKDMTLARERRSSKMIPRPSWSLYDRHFKEDVSLTVFREDYLLFQELCPDFQRNLRNRTLTNFFQGTQLDGVPSPQLVPRVSQGRSMIVPPEALTGDLVRRIADFPHLELPLPALVRLLQPKEHAYENFGDFLERYDL